MNLLPNLKYSDAIVGTDLCLPFGLLAARRVSMPKLQRAIEARRPLALEHIRANVKDIGRRIERFAAFFTDHGFKCPLPYQLRGVEKKGFVSISPSVDALLICEMANGLLMGVQDRDAVEGDLSYEVAQGGESFHGLRDLVKCKAGEIILRDARSIVASYFQGPNRRINVTPDTSSLLFFIFGAPGVARSAMEEAMTMTADIMSSATEEVGMKIFEE
ncbi:MAG: hypothetical protein HONDAALG_01693 [Gammaproteobacteria bacterium]|nr:hypothetical protein [Gammaproteobacteria bacterium]